MVSGGMHLVRKAAAFSQLGFQQVEIPQVHLTEGLYSTFGNIRLYRSTSQRLKRFLQRDLK